jgi:RimJ/RimL family protein N-acetyltransferase
MPPQNSRNRPYFANFAGTVLFRSRKPRIAGLHLGWTEILAKTHLPTELRTERLILRQWRPDDRELFAAMTANPEEMKYFKGTWSRAESDRMVDRLEAHFTQHGYGLWAVEIPGVTSFGGVIGLAIPHLDAHFTPCVEIGWRIGIQYWGRGYATEGARAALQFGFDQLELREIVAFTATTNIPSIRVMERLGMTRHPEDDFDHPIFPEGHPLRPHVLYRLRARDWQR